MAVVKDTFFQQSCRAVRWLVEQLDTFQTDLVALLYLSSWCLVMVEQLFLAVPRGCLRFVIVVFPDHTHLLFLIWTELNFTIYILPRPLANGIWVVINEMVTIDMKAYGPCCEKTCLRWLRTTKAQTSLCICTVWSAPLLFAFWKVSQAKFQVSR